jgi:hypothetical protein
MSEAPIIHVADGLVEYLGHELTLSSYPQLSGLALNVFDDPETTQYPLLDIHPVNEELVQQPDGSMAEVAIGSFEFVIQIEAAQYLTAVRKAFRYADELRRALNSPRAAQYAGVYWVRRGQVFQAEPDKERGRVLVSLQGRIQAKYSIEAR